METFIIDTNFFINQQRPTGLGSTKEDVVRSFVERYTPLVASRVVQFLSTPESFREIVAFFDDEQTVSKNLQSVISIQSPSLTTLSLSATLFHELVGEINKRLYKGMRVTEEIIKEIVKTSELPEQAEEVYVKKLRSQYRQATREGFLDSIIDLGLILLARETQGYVVSSDKGLLAWARKFGCKELFPEHMLTKLDPYLSKTK